MLIDANIYLSLWETRDGAELAPAIKAISKDIFLSVQVRREVHRNKLECAARFLAGQYKSAEARLRGSSGLPTYVRSSDDTIEQYRQVSQEAHSQTQEILDRMEGLSRDTLLQISQSRDVVSLTLASLF